MLDPFEVNSDPCDEWSDGECDYVDCGDSGFSMSCDFSGDDHGGDGGGGDSGGGDSGGGDSGGGCGPDGANPIQVHNGNVNRKIMDLPASKTGVAFARYHNSRGTSSNERAVFGTAGHWRHSWQFNLISGFDPETGQEIFNFRYPSGRKIALWRTGNALHAPEGYPEQGMVTSEGVWIETANGTRITFVMELENKRTPWYKITQAVSGSGVVYTLTYDKSGNLSTILRKDTGASLQFEYAEYGLKVAPNDRKLQKQSKSTKEPTKKIHVLTKMTDDAGRSVYFHYATTAQEIGEELALVRVVYGDGAEAVYEYSQIGDGVGDRALLTKADDPRYGGNAKAIAYEYYKPIDGFARGTIRAEKNPKNGQTWATLEYDRNAPFVRKIVYSDARIISYRLHPDGSGRKIEQVDSLGRKTSYEYKTGHRGAPTAIVDHASRRTDITRDQRGRVLGYTHDDGSMATMQRDTAGRLLFKQDRYGLTTSITRDTNGRTVSVTLPDGRQISMIRNSGGQIISKTGGQEGATSFTYDPQGRRLSKTDAVGNVTQYKYNRSSRISEVHTPDGGVKRYDYNDRGNVTTVENADGTISTNEYDNYGRLTKATTRDGRQKSYKYDDFSRVEQVTDHNGETTSYDYTGPLNGCASCNIESKPTTTVYPNGIIVRDIYDSEGHLLARTNAAGTNAQATTLYGYDDDGNLIQVTDALGRVTKHSYDHHGRLVKTTSPSGLTYTWEYDSKGNRSARTLPNGATYRYEYDDAGRIMTITNPEDNVTNFNYAQNGLLASTTDASGNVWHYEYDAKNRQTKVLNPAGQTKEIDYNSMGFVKTLKTPSGLIKNWDYDFGGRIIKGTDNNGVVTSREYDKYGRPSGVTDALGRTKNWDYDSRGNRVFVKLPELKSNRQIKNRPAQELFQALKKTNPSRYARKQVFDAKNRLTGKVNEAGNETRYERDASGNISSLTDANGNTYRFVYDGMNRLTSTIYPDNSKELWEYDSAGKLITQTTRAKETKVISYNVMGQRVSETWTPAGCAPNVIYSYDSNGRLSSVDNGDASLSYTYDIIGRITSETTDYRALLPDMAPQTIGYRYDALGRKAGLRYPDGTKISYVYDVQNRITEVRKHEADEPEAKKKPSGSLVAAYTYDTYGRRDTLTRANGVVTKYTYDLASQILAIDHSNKTKGIGILAKSLYEYDDLGRRSSMTREDNITEYYEYDATGQVIGVDYGNGRQETFTYDPLGNRIEHTDTVSATGSSKSSKIRHLVERYETNNLNQYTKVNQTVMAYDKNGNLVDDGTQRYRYDAQGRLVNVESDVLRAEFTYDARNRCIVRRYYTPDKSGRWILDTQLSVALVYDNRWEILSELRLEDALPRNYIHGVRTDEILTIGTRYPLPDALGSVIAASDSQGKMGANIKYSVSGKADASNANYRFSFTGRESLEPVGLNDHRNRYYSPSLGRWLSVDPIRFAAGDNNLYRYVFNSYIDFIDPDGLDVVVIGDQASVDAAVAANIADSPDFAAAWQSLGDASDTFWIQAGTNIGYDSYDATFRTLQWNPTIMWESDDGLSGFSPATAFGHEIDHAAQHEKEGSAFLNKTDAEKAAEEQRATDGIEKELQKSRGEGTRTNYNEGKEVKGAKNILDSKKNPKTTNPNCP